MEENVFLMVYCEDFLVGCDNLGGCFSFLIEGGSCILFIFSLYKLVFEVDGMVEIFKFEIELGFWMLCLMIRLELFLGILEKVVVEIELVFELVRWEVLRVIDNFVKNLFLLFDVGDF